MCTFIACREGEPGYEAISYVCIVRPTHTYSRFQEAQGWCIAVTLMEEVTEK